MRRNHGPSLFYASDKNVYDALNQHKVDMPTVLNLFEKRNIIVSKKTPRDELAKYFGRLSHDYYDHQDIARRLGIVPRRERNTSMDVTGPTNDDEMSRAVTQLKNKLEEFGDVVHVMRPDNQRTVIRIQYSDIDHKRSEFAQVQIRDGMIEVLKTSTGYTIFNTHNSRINNARDTLIANLEVNLGEEYVKSVVSLFDVPDHSLRTKFFLKLLTSLKGFDRRDVSDVYVYKPKPDNALPEDGDNEGEPETHIERVSLRGRGVTRSQILNDLIDAQDYYVVKIGWTVKERMGEGAVYDVEATFSDPKDCMGFSFLLRGIFPEEKGSVSQKKRPPTKDEIDNISRAIEEASRSLMIEMKQEFSDQKG